MQEKLKGVQDLEEELGVKLKKKEEKKGGNAITFEVHGKKYNTIHQNLADDFLSWMKARKGWRAVLMYFMLFLIFVYIAMYAPIFLGFIFIAPVIYIGGEILAYYINKGKKRPILELSVARKAVPVSLITDADGKEAKVTMFEPDITGWDIHYVWEEAISDSPHPAGVTIPDMVTIPHKRTKQKMGIIEYKSPDGKFGRANPFRTLNNYFLLSAYTKPHVVMSKEYTEFMEKLKTLPGLSPEEIMEIKESDDIFRRKIGDLSKAAYNHRKLIESHGAKLRSIANIKFNKYQLLTNTDYSSMPFLKSVMEGISSGRQPLTEVIDMLNDADAILEEGSDLKFLLPKLKYDARMNERAMRMKLREPDMATVFKAMRVDEIVSGAPKSPDILKEAEEAYEGDDEDGDN